MRGDNTKQSTLFSLVSPEQRVPQDHPLRPSIPPERLLKAQILIALYSIRSDRMFCEQLDYNLLFRWFLDMTMDEPSFDHSSFSKNRDRLLEQDVAAKFFAGVVEEARELGLMSNAHFNVDGTLIEACHGGELMLSLQFFNGLLICHATRAASAHGVEHHARYPDQRARLLNGQSPHVRSCGVASHCRLAC